MPWRDQIDSRDPVQGMLLWVSDHIIAINARLTHMEAQIGDINHRLAAGHHRMNRLERKPSPSKPSVTARIERATAALKAAKEFGAAVASFREWLVGALLVTGSASALHFPDPLAAILKWLLERLAG